MRTDTWTVTAVPTTPRPVHPTHPLASPGGIDLLTLMLQAEAVWRKLPRAQRELLLSTAAGAPVHARADVRRRLTDHGLIDGYQLTEAGALVVKWRLP